LKTSLNGHPRFSRGKAIARGCVCAPALRSGHARKWIMERRDTHDADNQRNR
jgi:hypothetical protein